MNILKHLLSIVAFIYLCYHIYTFGPGAFNITVMVIFILSVVANYFTYRNKNEMKANTQSRENRGINKGYHHKK